MARYNGTSGADRINGSALADLIYGRDGNDVLNGNRGFDRIWGENGNDVLNGGAGNDSLAGGAGNDLLRGGPGADRMLGGPGNDVLVGGTGGDVMQGGMGRDTFRFFGAMDSPRRAPDLITDFRTGEDLLDLRAMNLTYAGSGGHQGQRSLRWEHVGQQTHLLIDVNGDRQADMLIRLDGRLSLDGDDFLL